MCFKHEAQSSFLIFVQDFLVQPDYCMRTSVWEEQFRTFLFLAHFHSEENFVKCDSVTDTNFPSENHFEVENFQFLTMIFSENFLSVDIFLE